MKIAKNTETDLKFLVNEKEELTKAEFEKKYEGYKVSFLFNKSGAPFTAAKTTGKVTTSVETFKYAVQVEDAEGNKLPETVVAKDFADVKVVDAAKVTKVHELGLVSGNSAWKNPTVTQADQVKIVATVFENGLGTKTTDKDEEGKATTEATVLAEKTPTIAKVTSSDPTVAFYDNTKGIQVRKDGKVTFTVEFEDKDIEALQTTVKVTTVAKQTATSIKAEDLKVKADAKTEVKFDVLDQNDEKLRTNATVFVAVKPEGKKEAEATVLEVTAGAASTELTFEKGNNVVTVYGAKDDQVDKEVVLGTFKVEAVDVSDEAKIEKYKLVQAYSNKKDAEGNFLPLDLNIDKDVNNTKLELDVEAYIKDIKVGLKDGVELVAKSSDAKVVALTGSDKDGYATVAQANAKVTATAQAVGKSVITLYTKEGDLLTPVATYNVKVNDTTKAITELPFKEGVKHVTVKDSATAPEALKAAVIAAVDEKVKLTDAKIVKVETLKADGKVIVTMAKEYGGKEIVLPALYTSLEELTTEIKEELVGGSEGVDVTKAVTEVKKTTPAEKHTTVTVDGHEITVGSFEIDLKAKGYTVEATQGEEGKFTVSRTAATSLDAVDISSDKKVTVNTVEYTANTADALVKKLQADGYEAEILTADDENKGKLKVTGGEFTEATIDTIKTAATTTYEITVEEVEYKEATLEALKSALTAAGYNLTGSTEENLVVKKAAVEGTPTFTQTVTFTFSGNVTLAEDASFELKDADGKVIATEAEAKAGAKAVTIEIVTENEASPTVATATLEGATVNKILQIIKDEKVESTEG